jgi:hypothetical protein
MGFLKRLFFGKPPKRIEHPVLGEALLIETKSGSYWEVETKVAGRTFSVTVETVGDQEPTEAQVKFFEQYSRDPDSAFRKASALLVPEYEKWVQETFPSRWQEAFEFVGMSVPVAADERNPWDLSFECLKDRGRHLFTCSFENAAPTWVQVDG